MNRYASLLAVILPLASSFAWAEADGSEDLRYCLDLPTAQEIAKCSGEVSPGSKGRTYSREEVERILSEEKANAPSSASDPPGSPVTAGDNPDKDSLPETTESSSN